VPPTLADGCFFVQQVASWWCISFMMFHGKGIFGQMYHPRIQGAFEWIRQCNGLISSLRMKIQIDDASLSSCIDQSTSCCNLYYTMVGIDCLIVLKYLPPYYHHITTHLPLSSRHFCWLHPFCLLQTPCLVSIWGSFRSVGLMDGQTWKVPKGRFRWLWVDVR